MTKDKIIINDFVITLEDAKEIIRVPSSKGNTLIKAGPDTTEEVIISVTGVIVSFTRYT